MLKDPLPAARYSLLRQAQHRLFSGGELGTLIQDLLGVLAPLLQRVIA